MMRGYLLGLCLLVVALVCAPVAGQPLEELAPDTPVARVGDRTITAGEVLRETIHRFALGAVGEMLFQRFLADRCEEAGIVISEADLEPGQDIHRVRFERLYGELAEPSDEEIRAVYEGEPELYRLEVVPARGILLESEADARALIEGGLSADSFSQWARDVSLHESAAQGGDLGEVSVLTMPESPEVVAALLAPGEEPLVGPIETPQGWWLLLRGEPRLGPVPAFADVREMIRRDLRNAALERLWMRRHARVRRGTVRITPYHLWQLAGGPPPSVIPESAASAPGSGGGGA
jgi:hypothetical protein